MTPPDLLTERHLLARERELNLDVTLVCSDCDLVYEGEVEEGEPESCPLCSSENVLRFKDAA